MINNSWILIKSYKDINKTKFIIDDYDCNKWSFLVIYSKVEGYNTESNLFLELPTPCPNQINISNKEIKIDFFTQIKTIFLTANDGQRRFISRIDYYQLNEKESPYNFINEFKKDNKISNDLDINSFKIENNIIKPLYDEIKDYVDIKVKSYFDEVKNYISDIKEYIGKINEYIDEIRESIGDIKELKEYVTTEVNNLKEYVKDEINGLKTISYQKIIDVEVNDIKYLFNSFNEKDSYKIYAQITLSKKSYGGTLEWLPELPNNIEIHNNFHSDTTTDANIIIFDPVIKTIIVKNRSKKDLVIDKIIIYRKKEII